MYRSEFINAKSDLNRTYSIWQESENSRIELYDDTSWLILVDTFRNETELKANMKNSIKKYESETIGEKILQEVEKWTFNYKDGFVSIDDETNIYNGKQARILADYWGDLGVRKSVKDTTIYIENITIENGCIYVIRNADDVMNYLKGKTEHLRKAKEVITSNPCVPC